MSASPLDVERVERPALVGASAQLRRRYLKDHLARAVVWVGGLGVIGALLLIFVYLLTEVLPLFVPASVESQARFAVPGDGSPALYLAVEEQGQVGMKVGASGQVSFFEVAGGASVGSAQLPVGERGLTQVLDINTDEGELVAVLSDGSLLRFQHQYPITYPDNRKQITPQLIEDPSGPLAFGDAGLRAAAVREAFGTLLAAGVDASGEVRLKRWSKSGSLLGDASWQESGQERFVPAVSADQLLLDPLLGWLYVIDMRGALAAYTLERGRNPQLAELHRDLGALVTARQLAGGISLLLAHVDGKLSQWFPVRSASGPRLAAVREFTLEDDAAPTALGMELRRRGFAVGDAAGRVTMFYATSGRRIWSDQVLDAPVVQLAFNPRAQQLLALSADGQAHGLRVHNEHPEVSLSALWSGVWYEGYEAPEYLWQSSSASSDFEPKFSLTPLAVGTVKGAFYAMIFAIPLAVLGAVFTANFMSPQMRQVVKPSVEVLAALPSVVLGFLAGLWLAPFVETNLPGMFLALLLLPASIPLFGYIWLQLPQPFRLRVPPGWEAAILIPVIALVIWFCFALAKPIEALFFAGNMQVWMEATLGIGYTQRNALVVGIAMGVAVIPIIFSIAEDAIFSVPKHLTLGSLALGATPWQTLVGVVLPTASPGIFSAIMIGMGRAVGETMIVLMATGNTPVMDFSLFSGMRTLAANIAVEMPESEVGSTHFRLLFLAGLVLFIFTFLFNTLAELVRGRLRKRYSNL